MAISSPPPRQMPLITATVGHGRFSSLVEELLAETGQLKGLLGGLDADVNSLMSAPMTKLPGLPEYMHETAGGAACQCVHRRR